MPRNDDGFEDQWRGRANRRTGSDDESALGRGHGFGPDSSRGVPQRPRGDRRPPNRNYARVADERDDSTRESRGPETSRYLEDDAFSFGRGPHQGYGSRSRSMEATRPPRSRPRDEFDDDLVR